MSTVTVAEHAGFCFGVKRAVDGAYKALENADGKPVYCLGSLIHNKAVTDELAEKGLITVSDVSEVPDGGVMLIRAHGEPDSSYDAAKEKNIEILDFTCPFVAKIHSLAKKSEADGRSFLVIGDIDHPEVKGILGSTKLALGAVYEPSKARELISAVQERAVSVAAQTTISEEKFRECCGKTAGCVL